MKKGFTLIELLVVIVIIGALATLVLPGLLKNYQKALAKIMVTEENFIKDSASLAVKDYCNSPIKTENIAYCKNNGSNNGLINEEYGVYYMCVDTLRNYGYYDNSLEYEKTTCDAIITFEKDKNNKFVNPKTYVFCGDYWDPDYYTDESIDKCQYTACNFADCDITDEGF